MRLIASGLILVLIGGFFAIDAGSKSGWAHVQARVISVDTKCDMSSTSYGVLTKTTSTATIDCKAVDLFENLHHEKTWTVATTHLAHVMVPDSGGTQIATTLPVSRDLAPGSMITVLQSPDSAARVKSPEAVGQGMIAALAMLGGGALITLWSFARFNRRRRLRAAFVEAATQFSATAAPATVAASVATVALAAPGQAILNGVPIRPASRSAAAPRAFGRR